MCGYRGILSMIPDKPISSGAQRPPEWIFQDQCTPAEWAAFAHARTRFAQVQQQRQQIEVAVVPVTNTDHAPSGHGQQSMHAFGRSRETEDTGAQDSGRQRDADRQSTQGWNILQRSEQVELTFDVSTMTPVPSCAPQGAWKSYTRHGQAIIRQFPRPFTRHPNKLTPNEDDSTIDHAQLHTLVHHVEGGKVLGSVAQAIHRQPEFD